MNTFAACGIELKTVKASARKLDHGGRTSCCRSRICPRTVHPQFGFAIRGTYQTLAFCRILAHCGSAIRRPRPSVSADSKLGVLGLIKVGLSPIGKLFPGNSLARMIGRESDQSFAAKRFLGYQPPCPALPSKKGKRERRPCNAGSPCSKNMLYQFSEPSLGFDAANP